MFLNGDWASQAYMIFKPRDGAAKRELISTFWKIFLLCRKCLITLRSILFMNCMQDYHFIIFFLCSKAGLRTFLRVHYIITGLMLQNIPMAYGSRATLHLKQVSAL